VIKFSPWTGPYYHDIAEAFPQLRHMFSARHPKTCINSWLKMMSGNFEGIYSDETLVRYFHCMEVNENDVQGLSNELIKIKGRIPE